VIMLHSMFASAVHTTRCVMHREGAFVLSIEWPHCAVVHSHANPSSCRPLFVVSALRGRALSRGQVLAGAHFVKTSTGFNNFGGALKEVRWAE
jgi:hypothetical protein